MQNLPCLRPLALIPILLSAACAGANGENTATTSAPLTAQVTLPTALGGQTEMTKFAPNAVPSVLYPMGLLPPSHVPPPNATPEYKPLVPLTTPPATVDISQYATTPGNQGAYGSCSSWATGYTSLGWWINSSGMSGNPFNPMFLYAQMVPGCNDGTSLEQPLDLMKSEGQDTLAEFPRTSCGGPTSAQIAAAAPYKIASYKQYDLSGGAEAVIKSVLATGKPITLGIMVYSEFMNATASSYLVGPPGAGSHLYGGHAITALKYDDQGVWIENSWGPDWAKSGWAELSWDFVNGSTSYGNNVDDAVSIDGLLDAPPPADAGSNSEPDAATDADAGAADAGGGGGGGGSDAAPPGEGPTVEFQSPIAGGGLPAFTTSTITVAVSDPSATISSVSLTIVGPYGTSERAMTSTDGTHYSVGVEFGEADSRSLSVTATDANGKTATVTETAVVQPTAGGPSVQFAAPTNGDTLSAFTNATITATASDSTSTISTVTLSVVGPYGTITQPMTSTDGSHYSVTVEFGEADPRTISITVTDAAGVTATTSETIQIQ